MNKRIKQSIILSFALLFTALPVCARELDNFTDYVTNNKAINDTMDSIDAAITGVSASTTPADNSVTSAKIVNGAIVNADVNASAAIDFSKLAGLTSAHLLVGSAGGVATDVALSGDASITNGGVISVTDLTISGEAQGEILYNDGSGWESLGVGSAGQALITAGAGANPYWGLPSLALAASAANNLTAEAGANDYTIDFGTAGGAYTLTVPAVSGSDTFSFIGQAETFSGVKTFNQTSLVLKGGDANAMTLKVNETLTGAKTLNVKINDTDRTVDLGGNLTLAGAFTTTGAWTQTGAHSVGITTTGNTALTLPTTGTVATLAGAEDLSSKNLVTPTIDDGDADVTITSADQTDGGATVTIPDIGDAADTFVVADAAQTLTTKTIDVDSNTVSNINANELDPVAVGNYGIPFVLTYNLTNQAAAVNIYNANAPFKFLVIRAWSDSTSADGGTWKLNNGAGGAGTDMTNAVTVAGSADDFDEPTDYVYAECDIASSGSLSIVPDGGGALDAIIYIEAIRID